MRGPRNIARIVMGAYSILRGNLDIFLGSPVEIAATLSHYESPTQESEDESSLKNLHLSEAVLLL